MKKTITFLLIICALTSCARNPEDKNPIKVSVEILGKDTHTITRDGVITTYPIKISIRNQTDSTFSFWKMSCSYSDSFIFNSEGITLYYGGCDKNIEELVELSPKEEYMIQSKLLITDLEAVKRQKDLRLSFVLIRKNEYSFLEAGKSVFDLIRTKREKKKDLIVCDKPIKYDW